jgi:hypothetical protein
VPAVALVAAEAVVVVLVVASVVVSVLLAAVAAVLQGVAVVPGVEALASVVVAVEEEVAAERLVEASVVRLVCLCLVLSYYGVMGIREILQGPFYVDLILPIQKKSIARLTFEIP